MSSAAPIYSEIPINKQITNDLLKAYKDILVKHLDERILKEDKILSWMNNILIDAKEYFIKKYPNYDLFLYIYVCPLNVYFYSNSYSISIKDIDWCSNIVFKTDNLYSCLYFFFYKHYELNYKLEEYENEIIQKGREILKKYFKEGKYGKECENYIKKINEEHTNFILSKENKLRCYFINEIYQNTTQDKYFFKYLSYGKDIYSKIIQTYDNNSLSCSHYVFFFK